MPINHRLIPLQGESLRTRCHEHATRVTRNEEIAHDIAMEAFLRLIESGNAEPTEEDVRKAVDAARHRYSRQWRHAPLTFDPPATQLARFDFIELLRSKLDDKDFRLLVDYYLAFGPEETARRRKISPGALRVRVHRALKRAKKLLLAELAP